jgi:predicted protein tyrosine phosphatase
MDIRAFPRYVVENGLPFDDPYIIISITTHKSEPANIPSSDACKGILRLFFPDLDRPSSDHPNHFSSGHAQAIWDFVAAHKDEVKHIISHCDMGQCRSPAVAAAISKVLTGDDEIFFKRHTPNMHVFRTMLETYYEHNN